MFIIKLAPHITAAVLGKCYEGRIDPYQNTDKVGTIPVPVGSRPPSGPGKITNLTEPEGKAGPVKVSAGKTGESIWVETTRGKGTRCGEARGLETGMPACGVAISRCYRHRYYTSESPQAYRHVRIESLSLPPRFRTSSNILVLRTMPFEPLMPGSFPEVGLAVEVGAGHHTPNYTRAAIQHVWVQRCPSRSGRPLFDTETKMPSKTGGRGPLQ